MHHHFPRFSRLPAEIRCYIWRLALQQPRVHRLRIGPSNESFALYMTETLARSTITTRTILATCMESRFEAMRALPDCLSLAHGYMLRFNRHEDVICLARLEPDTVHAISELLQTIRQNRDSDQWLEQLGKVHNLAIELRNTSFIYDSRLRNEIDQLPLFLAAFTGLEWLFFVPRPTPDDPKTLRCSRSQSQEGVEAEDEDEAVESTTMGGNTQPEAGEISTDSNVLPVEHDDGQSVCGDWLRGETGLDDWYCWVPEYAIWNFFSDTVQVHFDETAVKVNQLDGKLRHLARLSNLTADEKRRLRSVRVEVMVHFREGVEPVYDL